MNAFRLSAVVLVALMALAGATPADAQVKGGGGRGFAGGGAHFGGGGAHFGGGGAHFGGAHFGGGGAHFGGARFGGAHFGGAHFGGARYGGIRSFAGRGGRAFAFRNHGISRGSRSLARATHIRGFRGTRLTSRGARSAGQTRAALRSLTARNALRTTAGRNAVRAGVAAGAIGTAFAANHAAHAGWFNRWHRNYFAYGWFGPVFWPYAYSDFFAGVFWPYDYFGYDPFWDYGYGGLYASLFYPYGYDDLPGYYAGPTGRTSGRRVANATPPSESDVRATGTATAMNRYVPLCGDDARDLAGVPVDQIQKAVNPTQPQQAALDDLANVSVTAAQTIKAACPSDVSLTPVGRLDALQKRLDALVQAADDVRGPLDSFYNSLSDEQKARFNAIGQRNDANRSRSLTQACTMADVGAWPSEQIGRAVQPTADQRTKLDALKNAMDQAANSLKATCPAEMPATPTARLAAMTTRLTAMRDAAKTVRGPLEDFYTSLSDEQKAQFNAIGRSRSAREG